MLETGRILTLSNGKEYVVVTSTVYNDKIYVYVANLNNENDTKVCSYINDELTELVGEELEEIEEILLYDLANND